MIWKRNFFRKNRNNKKTTSRIQVTFFDFGFFFFFFFIDILSCKPIIPGFETIQLSFSFLFRFVDKKRDHRWIRPTLNEPDVLHNRIISFLIYISRGTDESNEQSFQTFYEWEKIEECGTPHDNAIRYLTRGVKTTYRMICIRRVHEKNELRWKTYFLEKHFQHCLQTCTEQML